MPRTRISRLPAKSIPARASSNWYCESLERRQLLAFIVNGTEAGNLIEMSVANGTISVTVDGVAQTRPDSAESSVVINGLDGYDTIKVQNTGDNSVAVDAGAGEDIITLAEASGLMSNIASPVTVNGGTGGNILRAYDWSNTTAGIYHALTPTTYDTSNAAPVTYSNLVALHINAGERADTIVVDGTPANLITWVRPNGDADAIHVQRTGQNAYVSIDSSNNTGGGDTLTIGNGTGTALVTQSTSASLGPITVNTGGQLKLKAGGTTTVKAQSLTLTGTGNVDLTDNALAIDYGTGPNPLNALRVYIATGYNLGLWNGNGIRSSTAAAAPTEYAVGIVDSATIPGTYPRTFAGMQVLRPAVLVRQVEMGDADLDGAVTLSDFNRLATNFGGAGKFWADGDFDFNAVVNLADYNRLSANFGSTGVPAPPLPIGANVTTFGAIPNDGIDDTAAIRAAIDSLYEGNGAPTGTGQVGGVVYLPAGTFQISGTIQIKSGVKIQGAGATLTTIHDTLNESTHAAFELYSPFAHSWNIGAGFEDLTIYTDRGRGIAISPLLSGDLIDFRMANVRLSAGSVGIDMREKFSCFVDYDNVEIFNPGSTAIFSGRHDNRSFSTRLRNFRVTGTARSGFVPEKGLVMLTADVNVYGMSIDVAGAPVVPLYISGAVTIDQVQIGPYMTTPGGLAVLMEDCTHVTIDRLTDVGLSRRIKLVNAHDVQIKNMVLDGSSTWYPALAIVDAESYLRVTNRAGNNIVQAAPPTVPAPYTPTPMPTKVIDVRSFGAIANDGLDDAVAIQAAIDSVPLGDGLGATAPGLGAIIQFPAGTMNTSAPLRLPSGVWLRGQENASIIISAMASSFTSRGAVELYSRFAHGHNVGAGIINLGFNTVGQKIVAIKSDSSITGELKDLRMVGVRITPGSVGVDFRNVTLSHLDVDRIVVNRPTTTAFWFGKTDNSSHDNIVRGLRVNGFAPPGFVAEKGLWVFHGGYEIQGTSLEDVYPDSAVIPFYGSGSFKISGMFMEFPAQPSGVSLRFENCTTVEIDRLYHINAQRRIQLINVADAQVTNLGIAGTTALLAQCVNVDASSRLTLLGVEAQKDAGMLDDPRVIVKGVFNLFSDTFVETEKVVTGTNFVSDPGFTSVGDSLVNESTWQIWWGNGYQGQLGTFAVETVNGVKRLRINVPNAVNVGIKVRFNITPSAAGKIGMARWRIDGPTQAYVYAKDYGYEYPARAMNSMTAVRTNYALTAGEEMWVILPNAQGTYYLSQFGMVAAA